MSDAQGLLITFDGPDGVGKTTQFELVAQALRDNGHDVYTSHLLGGSPIGETLRQVMFSDNPRPARTNLHLSLAIYYALFAELDVKRQAGTIVLLDRSPLSLIAYQVYGDGLDETIGYQACSDSLEALRPDMIIVYSAPSSVLQERRKDRSKTTDYFEQQSNDYHARTVEGYIAAVDRYDATIVDADGSIAAVHTRTMDALAPLLV